MRNRWDLLEERLVRVQMTARAEQAMSLPEVLACLAAGDDLVGFRALRHHQHHAWFAFLVQLSAMALHRAGLDSPPTDPADWRHLLLDLADCEPTAFTLVAEDLARPAFMQPPVPEGNRHRLKPVARTPDMIDLLVTAKNHDLKAERIAKASPDHWVFALVTVQTMDGYPGRGNYGIARMNGGLGNRPCVAFTPGPAWGARFRRDVGVLRGARDELVREYGYRAKNGLGLLWLPSWDGSVTSKIQLAECDPFFIEVCRRIRLVDDGDRIIGLTAPTEATRTEDGDRHGVLGDPWTPIDRVAAKALTLPEGGFDYRYTQELLLGGKFRPGHAQRLASGDLHTVDFRAEALVRGQGKTGGYHVRELRIPARIRLTLASPSACDRLAAVSRRWIDLVASVRKAVLRPAVLVFLQGGPERMNVRDHRADRWTAGLDKAVDGIFFDHLFAAAEADSIETETSWVRHVLGLAREQLENAMRRTPVPSVRRYRAEAAAWRVFHGAARNRFPDLFAEAGEGGAHHD